MIFLWALNKKEWLKKVTAFAILFFLIVSTPLIPVILVNSLEDRYLPLDTELFQADTENDIHILVLGGGHGYDDRLPANALLSNNARGRLHEGIRLHRQIPGSKLVLSGSTSTPGKLTQAEMLQEAALILGVDEKAILIQKEPINTCQEAREYANRFGIDVIPSATNYRLNGSWKKKTWVTICQ